MSPPETTGSVLSWDKHGAPRSELFGDVYFSNEDGLAETRAVFLEGCRLPNAWAGKDRFCVAELGFGTGLNILALLDVWRRTRGPMARLSIFSVEAHPLMAVDASRALARWPELDDIARVLIARWPGTARGFHRVDLPEFNATLDVAIMEAMDALGSWSGRADAWFLDGFAPARNPQMWRPELLGLVAARSAPGARAASFTVASQVRRDLAAVGFEVERRPGFGRKRHRLEAYWPKGEAVKNFRRRVAVIGAGIAGASLSRAFMALGSEATLFDAAGAGNGASGGPAALVAPRLDAGLGDNAALFAQALRRAGDLYQSTPEAIIARGAVQRPIGPKDPGRFAAIAASDLFEPGGMRLVDEGLRLEDAVVVEPAAIIDAWTSGVTRAQVASLAWNGAAWSLIDDSGATLAEADIVCLAAGMASAKLAPALPLHPVRGQASHVVGAAPVQASLFGSYVLPTRDGLLFGATHDRDDSDDSPRSADHTRNLAALAEGLPALAAELEGRELRAWTGIRATTRDYLPLAGAVPQAAAGLFVLSGLGSRGFTLAPLLAEHIAALALGVPSPLPRALADTVDPARFQRRESRRGRPRPQAPPETPG